MSHNNIAIQYLTSLHYGHYSFFLEKKGCCLLMPPAKNLSVLQNFTTDIHLRRNKLFPISKRYARMFARCCEQN